MIEFNDPAIGETVDIAFEDHIGTLITRRVLVVRYVGMCVDTDEEVYFGPEEIITRQEEMPEEVQATL